MQPEKKKKLLRGLGYTAFFLMTFTFFVYQTFPYKHLFDRFSMPFQQKLQARISMEDLGLYWLTGVEAKDLEVRKMVKKGIAAIHINELQAHASLFSLIIGNINADIEAKLARGKVNGSVGFSGKTIKLDLRLSRINLASLGPRSSSGRTSVKTSLLNMLFAPVYGRVKARVKLKIPLTRRRRANMTKAKGTIKIRAKRVLIGPGYFPTPNMGELPVPLIRLGTVAINVKIAKGVAKITKCVSVGQDAELKLTGNIRLRSNMRYSVLRGKLKFKIKQSFVDSKDTPDLLKLGIRQLPRPKRDGFVHYRLRVPFSGRRPSIRPIR